MAHRVLITMDDLEAAVRVNAAFEGAGFETAMVSAQDDARATVAREDPDLVVMTGGLHEATAGRILGTVRDGRVATLALLEPTEADPAIVAQRMGLTAAVTKPADPWKWWHWAGASSNASGSRSGPESSATTPPSRKC